VKLVVIQHAEDGEVAPSGELVSIEERMVPRDTHCELGRRLAEEIGYMSCPPNDAGGTCGAGSKKMI
jgi:hypothetical protein